MSEQTGLAGISEHEAHEHTQRRRLAGPVRTEKAADVALLDGEVEVVDSEHGPEPLGEPGNGDDRLPHFNFSAKSAGARDQVDDDVGQLLAPVLLQEVSGAID